jgi:hypothetical protein
MDDFKGKHGEAKVELGLEELDLDDRLHQIDEGQRYDPKYDKNYKNLSHTRSDGYALWAGRHRCL